MQGQCAVFQRKLNTKINQTHKQHLSRRTQTDSLQSQMSNNPQKRLKIIFQASMRGYKRVREAMIRVMPGSFKLVTRGLKQWNPIKRKWTKFPA